MPVNGIELKEGQKWKTLSGRVATLEDNPGAGLYIFRTVYEDGKWDTITKDGNLWASDYNSFLRELIYDPEQQVKEKLTMKFNPKPGDKIICNNGEEFICCTLENLNSKGVASYLKDEVDIIFGISENWEDNCSWMYWQGDNYPKDHKWEIQEVIPQNAESSANKKEEVKEEPRYTVEEVFDAIKEHCGKYNSPLGCEFEIKNLLKRFDEDPEYKEYLRLKAIYE